MFELIVVLSGCLPRFTLHTSSSSSNKFQITQPSDLKNLCLVSKNMPLTEAAWKRLYNVFYLDRNHFIPTELCRTIHSGNRGLKYIKVVVCVDDGKDDVWNFSRDALDHSHYPEIMFTLIRCLLLLLPRDQLTAFRYDKGLGLQTGTLLSNIYILTK